jgi:general secretion pathway protein L
MPRLIALDLGSHAVKVTVFRTSGRRYTLEGRYSQEVPQNGEKLPSMQTRLAALDVLLDDNKSLASQANTFSVCWPGDQATIRRLVLPFTDRGQVEKTIRFAVEAEVPFDMDDMVMSWRVLSATGETVTQVALVQRNALSNLIGELADRKIEPRYVFIDGDLLGAWGEKGRNSAIIDVGHADTEISIVVNGTVSYVRSIDVGGFAFTRAIMHSIGCSWQQAEALKHGDTDVPEGEEALPPAARAAVDAAMGLLLAEIRSTLITAEDELGVDIDEIRLTGGGGRMDPLADYLLQDLGVPVSRPLDLEGDPMPGPYAVSQALAMRMHGLTQGGALDMRVDELSFRGAGDFLKSTILYAAILMLFFAVFSTGFFAYKYRGYSQEQRAAEQGIKDAVIAVMPTASVPNGTVAKSIMDDELRKAREKSAMLGDGSVEPPTLAVLLEVTEALPKPEDTTVDVSQMTVTESNITFTMVVDGYQARDSVVTSLQANERFAAAESSNCSKRRDKVQCSVTIPLIESEEEGG